MLNNLQGTKVAVINFPALWERCKLELLKQKQFQEWKAGPEFTALTNQLVEAKKAFEDYKRVIGNAPLTTSIMLVFSTPEEREHNRLQSTVRRYERDSQYPSAKIGSHSSKYSNGTPGGYYKIRDRPKYQYPFESYGYVFSCK
jgi:hypothetical protein